ncbi:MAG TPA: hypothetical protein VFV19_02155 [Candidatus Polarisedimenticolaceae bacterium]|nr:hypothetical protein [Candidatus Polarisedimenticolaceae bacterium]
MTRETRIIVILVGFGAAGVGALAFVAHQYERALGPKATTQAAVSHDTKADAGAALPLVDAFLAVRAAQARAAERLGVKADDRTFGDEALAACRVARLSTAGALGIDGAAYLRVRDAWRAWSRGEAVEPALASAFQARLPSTSRERLGPGDALDLAIKP